MRKYLKMKTRYVYLLDLCALYIEYICFLFIRCYVCIFQFSRLMSVAHGKRPSNVYKYEHGEDNVRTFVLGNSNDTMSLYIKTLAYIHTHILSYFESMSLSLKYANVSVNVLHMHTYDENVF